MVSSRVEPAVRTALAVVGGYLLASALAIALPLVLPMPRAEAVLAATLLGFVVHVAVIIWVFAVADLRWVGLSKPAHTSARRGSASGGLRQSMAWLHTWCGLWFCWLLFAVFFTGTLAVFAEPIGHWMTPEHHAEEAAEAARPKVIGGSLAQRLDWAAAYMAQHHAQQDMWEIWPADADGGGDLKVYWFEAGQQYAQALLDPGSGAPLPADPSHTPTVRGTLGGQHFVDFHYRLHAGQVGLWIVAIASMAMLVALVSGVITHKRIFKDFFTWRPRKGQRSWLDAHNAAAVLSLPFQFMIVYTGIVFFATTYLPAGMLAHDAGGGSVEQARQRFETRLTDAAKPVRRGQALAVPPLAPFALRAQQLMGQPARAVVVDHPGDAAMRVAVYGWNDAEGLRQRLSDSSGMVSFSAATGEVLQQRLPGGVEGGATVLTRQVMGNLHMVGFGGLAMKWLYFIGGLAGAAMMATGGILFMVKRRQKGLGEFGAQTARVYRVVEALNIAAIAGLAMACIAYLWANRLIPVALDQRAAWELKAFFAVWAVSLLHALLRAPVRAWAEQLGLLSALCLLLPVLNLWTTGEHLPGQIVHGDWESAGVELTALVFGALAAGAAWWVRTKTR